jgi:hypothetical protein
MPDPEPIQESTFRKRVLKTYFVRFHMGMILTSVIATGVLGSKLLLFLGLHSMALRYPIAVLLSYATFLLMVRIWIWWVTGAKLALDLSLLNNTGGSWGSNASSTSANSSASFGGGQSGGGGASSSWASTSSSPSTSLPVKSGGKSGSWFSDLGNVDGDDWWILLLLALLVLSILFAGGYLIYAAPQILPEAAWQAAMAGGLHCMTKSKPDWMTGMIRSSALPFAVVLLMATVLGWQAQKHCPGAARLMQVFQCAEPAQQ